MKIRDLIGEAPLNTNDPKKGLFTRKTWDQSQDAISGAGDAFAKGFGIGGPGPKTTTWGKKDYEPGKTWGGGSSKDGSQEQPQAQPKAQPQATDKIDPKLRAELEKMSPQQQQEILNQIKQLYVII